MFAFSITKKIACPLKFCKIHYFHKDHLGSSTVISTASGKKEDVESTAYLPYGGRRGSDGISRSSYRFTDQEFDGETGLYNYDARLYDPTVSIFITPDSIVPDQHNPRYLNRYTYLLNNPLIYTDPSGHEGRLIIHSYRGKAGKLTSGHSWLEWHPSGKVGERKTFGTFGNTRGRDKAIGLNMNTEGELYGDQGAERDAWLNDDMQSKFAKILYERKREKMHGDTLTHALLSLQTHGKN